MHPIRTGQAIAAEMWTLTVRPRDAVRARRADVRLPSAWTVLGAATATALVLVALYGQVFGSLIANASAAAGSAPFGAPRADAESAPSSAHATAGIESPTITGFRFHRGFGLAVLAGDQDASGLGAVEVRAGLMSMRIAGVTLEGLDQGAFPFVMAAALAFLTAVCLHPPARALGGNARFVQSLDLAVLFCAYSIVVVTVVSLVAMLLLLHTLHLSGRGYVVSHTILTQVPILGCMLHSYFVMFSEHFGIGILRVVGAAIAGLFLTALAAPLILFPAVYLTIRFEPVLDVLF